jgi:hypothetical protein
MGRTEQVPSPFVNDSFRLQQLDLVLTPQQLEDGDVRFEFSVITVKVVPVSNVNYRECHLMPPARFNQGGLRLRGNSKLDVHADTFSVRNAGLVGSVSA